LIEIEHQWAKAYESGNSDKLASILSRDYIQTNTRARVTDKDEEVADLRKGTFRYEKFETTQMRVQLYGDAAVVTGLISAKGTDKATGKSIEGQMRMTDTFIRQDGRWQVVASQTTLVPTETRPSPTPGG
jgi:ketosteroid isomerase-like protein